MSTRPRSSLATNTYRFVSQIADPRRVISGIVGYPRYFREYFGYRRMLRAAQPGQKLELFPTLFERTTQTGFDAHYSYMGHWALQEILAHLATVGGSPTHVDVGSQISWLMALAACADVATVDIRPYETHLPSLRVTEGSILDLPYAANSVPSLSCLHVVEHIGLGRYGDDLNPQGSAQGFAELARVLAPGGRLFFAVPTGRERTCFNAHRVFAPDTVLGWADRAGLELHSAAAVFDDRSFRSPVDPRSLAAQEYACGMFVFGKRR